MDSPRHTLVIGSQCHTMPHLEFVPQRVKKLLELMVDPLRGGCQPDGSAALIDPDLAGIKSAVKHAVATASLSQASLIIIFVGHGVTRQLPDHGLGFFLLPADGDAANPTPDTAFDIASTLKYLMSGPEGKGLDGLFLILDACHSGSGAVDVMKQAGVVAGSKRMQILTSTFDEVSYDGCFSNSLISLISRGNASLSSDYIGGAEAANAGAEACGDIQEEPYFSMAGRGAMGGDKGLFLTRNVASRSYWALSGTREGEYAVSLTAAFQPNRELEHIIGAMAYLRLIVLVGEAGSGKSSIASALARPELLPDRPARYLSAIAYVAITGTLAGIADCLANQLHNREGFSAADAAYRHAYRTTEFEKQPAMERRVFGPLRRMEPAAGRQRIRLVIDGVDQLGQDAQEELLRGIEAARRDPWLERVTVLLTTRPQGRAGRKRSSVDERIEIRSPRPKEIREYFKQRNVSGQVSDELTGQRWTWLELSLLAGTGISAPVSAPGDERLTLDFLYREWLSRAAPEWDTEIRALLAVLAASGSGPNLPISIAVAASTRLGGPATYPQLRDLLPRLGTVVARTNAGTEEETLGLFHETLVQYLGSRNAIAGIITSAHQAILDVIESSTDPVTVGYKQSRGPEHLWGLERYEQALEAVLSHLGPRANDNMNLLESWSQRARAYLVESSSVWQRFRSSLAYWTGEAGRAGEAASLCAGLLADQQRVLGEDHAETLRTRSDLACWTGEAGRVGEAVSLCAGLLADQQRVLGEDHAETLRTRSNLARWTGEAGRVGDAVSLCAGLLADQQRVLGEDHAETLRTRRDLARWTGEAGRIGEATAMFADLLEDQLRLLPPDSPDTLTTRVSIAYWTGKAGKVTQAVTLFTELLEEQRHVLGPDDPDTLMTRYRIAYWTRKSGRVNEATALFADLLEDRRRVLGPDHPETLNCRHSLAYAIAEAGNIPKALKQYKAVLVDRLRVQGPDHPDTLNTRYRAAEWTRQSGQVTSAIAQYRGLLADRRRIQGDDHPDTLDTRDSLAYCIAQEGSIDAALEQFNAILADRLRIQGPDHPGTLNTRYRIAYWVRESGDVQESVALFFDALLRDQVRVLGADHPDTLNTRHSLASSLGMAGNVTAALKALQDVLNDRLRIQGKDHPDTLNTRYRIACWTSETGDIAAATKLLTDLLKDRLRIQGERHPDTISTREKLLELSTLQ